jgi:hypothetical protein
MPNPPWLAAWVFVVICRLPPSPQGPPANKGSCPRVFGVVARAGWGVLGFPLGPAARAAWGILGFPLRPTTKVGWPRYILSK